MISLSERAGDVPAILDEEVEGEIVAIPTNEPEVVAFGDRLLRELRDVRAEREANDAACQVEVQRLKDRFTDLDVPLARREGRLLGLLEQVAHALPLRGKRSRDLAFGRIGWKAKAARLEIEDEEALDQWVKAQDFELAAHLIRRRTVESIDKAALDKHALDTGEMPDGCKLLMAEDRFYANPSAEPHA